MIQHHPKLTNSEIGESVAGRVIPLRAGLRYSSSGVHGVMCPALLGLFASLFLVFSSLATNKSPNFLEWRPLPPLPDVFGFAAPFAGVSGDALIVAGGANFPEGMPWEGGRKIWHDSIFVLTDPKGEWKTGFKLPKPNGYGISITTKEGLVCIGGGNAKKHFTEVFRLKWQNNEIVRENLPTLPKPIAFASGALLGDTIYVAGGIETPDATNTLKVFWSLDISDPNAQWKELDPWPGAGRMLAVAAAQDGSFFLVGGTDLTSDSNGKPQRIYLKDGFRYTPGKGWKQIADLPRPAVAAPSPAPTIGQSHFLILGGDDGSKTGFAPMDQHPGFPSDILAYHAITDTWAKMGTAPISRVTVPAVHWQNKIIIPSGEVRPGVRSSEVWSAEPITFKSGFSKWDYLTLGTYLSAMVGIGLYCSRRHQTTKDFFLAGQRIPWWAAGLSIFGTQLSAITFLAIPAKVYATDWTYFLNNVMIVAIAPVVVFCFLPFYRRLNLTTAYEYLERRFNLPTRLVAAFAFCALQMARMGIVLFLPALALSAVTGLNIYLSILLMGILTTLYSATGGMEAVVWTDVAQVLVLLTGAVVSLFLIANQVDGGFGTIVSTGWTEGKFHMLNWDLDLTQATVWVLVVGSFLSHLIPYSADQSVVQRYLTTRDEKQAARSIWTNALLVIPATLLFFALGTALYVFYKTHPQALNPNLNTDAIYPWFIANYLPPGIIGLVIAGVFAAAMSSLDSSINSVATVVTTDFYRRLRPAANDKSCLRLARILTVILGVLGTSTALWMAGSDIKSLWDTFLKIFGLLGGSLAGLFVLGIFTRRTNGQGAIIGMVTSAILLWWVQTYTPLHFFLFGGIGILTCVIVGYTASRCFPSSEKRSDGLTIFSIRKQTHSINQSSESATIK